MVVQRIVQSVAPEAWELRHCHDGGAPNAHAPGGALTNTSSAVRSAESNDSASIHDGRVDPAWSDTPRGPRTKPVRSRSLVGTFSYGHRLPYRGMHRQPTPPDFDERTASVRTLMISKLFRVPNFKAIIVHSVESVQQSCSRLASQRRASVDQVVIGLPGCGSAQNLIVVRSRHRNSCLSARARRGIVACAAQVMRGSADPTDLLTLFSCRAVVSYCHDHERGILLVATGTGAASNQLEANRIAAPPGFTGVEQKPTMQAGRIRHVIQIHYRRISLASDLMP